MSFLGWSRGNFAEVITLFSKVLFGLRAVPQVGMI